MVAGVFGAELIDKAGDDSADDFENAFLLIGSFEQLAPLPISVSPADVQGTADALYAALNLSAEERGAIADELRRRVEAEDAAHWLVSQLADEEEGGR